MNLEFKEKVRHITYTVSNDRMLNPMDIVASSIEDAIEQYVDRYPYSRRVLVEYHGWYTVTPRYIIKRESPR